MKINTLEKINPVIAIRRQSGLENTAASWTLHLIAPLFTWNPKPEKSHLVQGELFPKQLEDGSLKKPQPVAFLEA
jgi:hypothetical protein